MLATLSAGLSACGFLFPGAGSEEPRVSSVDPANGATNVALSSSVRATLSLPGGGGLNVTTLSDTAVTLTDVSGVAVPAKRTLEGNTIVLDPDADLVLDASYTFKVTSAVETADGTALQAFNSSFSTGNSVQTPPETGLSATPAKIVFTAGSPTGSDTQTLTLTNDGTEALNVSGLSVTGADAAQFALSDSSTFSLAPGTSRELSLTFNSKGVGPQLAALSVQSSASSLEVPLGGLGVEGQGGNKEPSLQWILDTYGIDINTGDADPSTFNLIDSPTNGFVGAEVAGQTFTKAVPTQPVTAEVLATFGVENNPVLDFGYYTAGQPDAKTALFNIQQTPTLNAQRLAPEVTAAGGTVSGNTVTFDPGTVSFGLYSFWPTNKFFKERTIYTEDAQNTYPQALPHQVRTYPLPGEANAYVVATEEFNKGFDYNDIVIILRNVMPAEGDDGNPKPVEVPPASGISGLNVSTELGLPYNDRLVLERIGNILPDPCDFDAEPDCDPDANPYEGITFPTTGTVNLQNTDGSALQLSLSFLNDNLFVFPEGENTITVNPGETYPLEIEFNPSGSTKKGVYPAGLVIQSGGQSAGIQLVGAYQTRPGGGREISLVSLSRDLFGYTTDMGTKTKLPGPEADTTPLVGDEVRSNTWEAADPASPVTALQIAAFHDCCRLSYPFGLNEPGSKESFASMKPLGIYGQSIYPRGENDSLTELSANTTGPFEVYSAGYSSDPSKGRNKGNLGVRFWPLKDRGGNLLPNTYIVGQDFVITGCTATTPTPEDPDEPEDPDGGDLVTGDSLSPAQSAIIANCDYNDNVYIIRNVKPVN